jgi:hypothetical protein
MEERRTHLPDREFRMSDKMPAASGEPATTPTDAPAAPAGEQTSAPSATDTGAGEGKDWQAEAEKWKALARKHEDRWKEAEPAVARLAQIEAEQMTEAQKAEAAREAAEQRAAALLQRTAKAEAKTLAADFADPEDALVFLGDVTRFASESGDIDADAIRSELSDLLARKPHLAKAAQTPKAPPANPAQGTTDAVPSDKGPLLTRDDISRLSKAGDFAAIEKARAEGRIDYSKR